MLYYNIKGMYISPNLSRTCQGTPKKHVIFTESSNMYIYLLYIDTLTLLIITLCLIKSYSDISVLRTHWWEQHTCLLCGYTPSSIFNFDIFQPSVFTERPRRSERERETDNRMREKVLLSAPGSLMISRRTINLGYTQNSILPY